MKDNKMNPLPQTSRRDFLKASVAFGALTILPSYIALGKQSGTGIAPSDKVNLAVIGIGNQGGIDLRLLFASGHCNVVALCDIDLKGAHTRKSRDAYPSARTFTDFRVMFDKMGNEIDAVLIATPDHSHFAATMLAMSLGKHVYVEKPLAHTFGQCERMIDLAARSGVVTQMGNQGHSGANYFQFKAWREAGIIRDITKITATMNGKRRWHGWGTDTTEYPSDPMPESIAWEQWHDVVAVNRPFSKRLHPQEWRSWFEFGSGAFGDWGPHILDTCHRFLELGLPETITAVKREGANDLVFPQASTIRFDFPERADDLPACEVTWYDGRKNRAQVEPEFQEMLTDKDTGEVMKVGGPGKMLYSKDLVFKGGHHGEPLQIVPREKFIEMRQQLPKFPQKNSNHYTNFLLACKGEEETRSPFKVGGELTQVFNLGVLAQRLGGEIKFDRTTKQITNNKVAAALMDPAPRKGWEEYYAL
ncbi:MULTISPECIES: Gfo/Idh/MocA family oxidoreductase [unclassified Lentimonas]|uniref:Gfo/Idh/MocA family oxidoreductase n=1 Tax=unclassified Lentimonas TaxID=2630993 RepID=UPI0013242343|nr:MULTISPECIES: Gfo/Idh/MocA family oxidoreductase [unclassified Lentimonas]CAA6696528.1 putative dehydrogenase [Lentimonas sp. CC19]CAA6696664.1 putative dehydrogenase [Lentimonas sp. CC10]CAA7072454.1 putative dehydrogenase [Lentimonas sp. CC11]